MEEQPIDISSETITEFLDGLEDVIEKTRPEPDYAFEILKSLVPKLWDVYQQFDPLESDDYIKSAAKFCVMTEQAFLNQNHRIVVTPNETVQQPSEESEAD